MSYRYKKRRYYNNRNYQRGYNPAQDLAMGMVGVILFLGYVAYRVYQEKPFLFWGGVFLIIASVIIVFGIIKKRRDRKYIKTRTIDEMKAMSWRDFEKFIEFLFKQNGFKAKVGKGKNDGGIDVTATKNGETYLVQCKKWERENIGVQLLREFYGVMNMDSPTTKGVYVTTSKLTEPAQKEYEKIKDRLELWDCYTIEEHIKSFKQHKDTLFQEQEHVETEKKRYCEKCGAEMVYREARRGEHKGEHFYGCSNYPKCRFTIKIEN